MTPDDFAAVNLQDIVSYGLPSHEEPVTAYKIGFHDKDSKWDFILAASNCSGTELKAHIIKITPSESWEQTASFSGDVTFQTLDRAQTEVLNIVDGYRTNTNQTKLVMSPPLMFINILPEVIIVSHTPSGGHQNHSLAMNLMSWLGLGNGNISNLLMAGYGNSNTDMSVYGPFADPFWTGNENGIGSSHVITTGNGIYDPNNPYSDLNNPTIGTDESEVNNGVEIFDWQLGQQQNPKIVAISPDRGNTEDMEWGTPSSYGVNTTGILPEALNATDQQNFSKMRFLFEACTIFDGELSQVGRDMINHFYSSSGTRYSNPILNRKVGASGRFHDYLKIAIERFDAELRNQGDNFNNFNGAIDLGNQRPVFNTLYHKFHGLQILVNDTEKTEIELSDFQWIRSNKWQANVTIRIYDHFGLDKHDALTYQDEHIGFASWWVEQHRRGFRPLETYIEIKKVITFTRP